MNLSKSNESLSGIRKLFFISFSILSITLIAQILICIYKNGMFSYPLDDTYIHMAIAKNIVRHGVWGISKYGFTSSSSSILYPLVLSLFYLVAGPNIWAPLVINWVAAGMILYFVIKWTRTYLSWIGTLLFSILFIFLVPLPVIVLIGMEHTLHVLFCLIFIYMTFKKFNGYQFSNWVYLLIAALAVSFRYESMFLVGFTALSWLIIPGKRYIFFILALGIVIPITCFGIYSIYHGGFFLPNSLLVKGPDSYHSVSQFIISALKKIYDSGLIYSLMFVPAVYFFIFPIGREKSLEKHSIHLLLFVIACTCLAHFLFARLGRPYRYGAYLIALELMFVPVIFSQVMGSVKSMSLYGRLGIVFFSILLYLPVLFRFGATFKNNISMSNIRNQQVYMALFLKKYFPTTTVALNDIGAVAFYNDNVRIFDLVGLANNDVIRYHRGSGDSAFLKKYIANDHVEMAIVYPDWIGWLGYTKPSAWTMIGSWYLKDNYIAGNSRVSFYSIDPAVKDTLTKALESYSSVLPSNVIQKGEFMRQAKERE